MWEWVGVRETGWAGFVGRERGVAKREEGWVLLFETKKK
jgi:hypothetical protein